MSLRVERRRGLHRIVDAATGRLALDEQGQPLDEGGAHRRVQLERRVARLEGEARARQRGLVQLTGRASECSDEERAAVLAEARRRQVAEMLERGVLVVKAVNRETGMVTIGLPPAGQNVGQFRP